MPASTPRRSRFPELQELLALAGADPSPVLGTDGQKPEEYTQQHVNSLKHVSRLSVRAAVKTNYPIKVHKLRELLPPTLVNYILLADIDDIERKYNLFTNISK